MMTKQDSILKASFWLEVESVHCQGRESEHLVVLSRENRPLLIRQGQGGVVAEVGRTSSLED